MFRSTRISIGLAALALMSVVSASADTVWDVNASFTYDGLANAASGNFTLDPSLNLVAWNITVSGTNLAADDIYSQTNSNDIPVFPDLTHLDFYDAGTNQYIDFYLSFPLSSAGGVIGLLEGDDGETTNSTIVCAGCGVLDSGSLSSESSAVPEPKFGAFLVAGLVGLGYITRRIFVARA